MRHPVLDSINLLYLPPFKQSPSLLHFWLGTTAAATTGAVTLSSGSLATIGLLGGVVLLKGLVLGAALLASRSRGRGRREAVEDNEVEGAFAILQSSEPSQCYRRLICDLAAGAIPGNYFVLFMSFSYNPFSMWLQIVSYFDRL